MSAITAEEADMHAKSIMRHLDEGHTFVIRHHLAGMAVGEGNIILSRVVELIYAEAKKP